MSSSYKEGSNTILVKVNNKEMEIPEGITADDLLELRNMKLRSSVWINKTQLLLSEYSTTIIKAGDEIKILRVIAGG